MFLLALMLLLSLCKKFEIGKFPRVKILPCLGEAELLEIINLVRL
jgi:hypothetical protein